MQTKLASHLFIGCGGHLHDTRMSSWYNVVVRERYKYTFGRIDNTHQLRATLRTGEFAWPGGYPMFLITADGGALHFDCARENYREIADSIKRGDTADGWNVCACNVNWEDPELHCGHCGERIESAYTD